MAVKGRASSREANIRDSAANLGHCHPSYASCQHSHGSGCHRTLEETSRLHQENHVRLVSHISLSCYLISSGSSKEDDTETPGEQDVYDLGARRGSNYKTPMERF